jgi:hypothetical protein
MKILKESIEENFFKTLAKKDSKNVFFNVIKSNKSIKK